MQILLERIEVKRAGQRVERRREIAVGFMQLAECGQATYRQAAVALLGGGLPIVERRRVGQAEALEEIAAIEIEGRS